MSAWTLGPFRAVGHRFTVRGVGAAAVRARLEHALAPLADPAAEPDATYRVEEVRGAGWPRYRLEYDGRLLHASDGAGQIAAYLLWHVNGSVVRVDRGEHLLLHASAAELDGCTVVLAAPMESGKTTTVAGLLRAGYRYVTDETVVLDRDDLTITAFPKALSLDHSAVALIGDLPAPAHLDAAADSQRQVTWTELGSPGVASGGRPGLLVFPKYRPRARTAVERVAPAAAVLELAGSTFRFPERPRRNLDLLARLATTVPAYRLAIGDLDEAVRLVTGLVCEHTARKVPA